MNNRDRIQARIERDKRRRAEKKAKFAAEYDCVDKIITHQHVTKCFFKCKCGVMWKGKPQVYAQHGVSNNDAIVQGYKDGSLPKVKYVPDMLHYERGKAREITPIQFDDRIGQRVWNDYSFTPIIQRTIIYDNGASTPEKGVQLARDRMELFLRRAIRRWGENFYILTFDFKNFFNSIPHLTCYNVLSKLYTNQYIIDTLMRIVKAYHKAKIEQLSDRAEREMMLEKLERNELHGITLGSHVSQNFALLVPSRMDHYFKDECMMEFYERYMDDGDILCDSKERLQQIYEGAKKICTELDLEFNALKTKIVKATKGFSFLKVKYKVVGKKLIKRLVRSGIVRMRRKLHKFVRLVKEGRMTKLDVYNSIQAWVAHSKIAQAYKTVKRMMKLYNKLFDGYLMTKKYLKHIAPVGGSRREILQIDKWSTYHWNWDDRLAA